MSIPATTLISGVDLTCIREDRILFEQLNFQINAGDIVQIEGPNGAGKTSLLRILCGLTAPFEGEVLFKQKPISVNRELYHQNLVYLGHLPGVKGEMSALENLEFNLSLHGLDATQAEDTLSKVNLFGFEDSMASHLSAGQHRRIALARLFSSKSPIWILDEPFTAIDKSGVKRLEELFVAHAQAGGCVILTTHQDLSLPAELVKKISLEYRLF